MKFCPKCGTRLRFRRIKTEDRVLLAIACDRCSYYEETRDTLIKPEEGAAGGAQIKVVGSEEQSLKTMPTIAADCPKCGHNEAFWWFLQTRSGDEPPTQFYRCTKCSHTWRVYT